MKILIDTNILIDVFAKREPYVKASAAALRLCGGKAAGYILAGQTTDVFYILSHEIKNNAAVKEIIKTLTENLNILDVTVADINKAVNGGMEDYEDALLAYRGKRANIDLIVTRNDDGFKESPVPAITPEVYLKKYFEG